MASSVLSGAKAFTKFVCFVCLLVHSNAEHATAETKHDNIQGTSTLVSFHVLATNTFVVPLNSFQSALSSTTIGADDSYNLNLTLHKERNTSKRDLLQEMTQFSPLKEDSCILGHENVTKFYNKSLQVWLVTEDVLEAVNSDIQLIIECAKKDDVILFQTKAVIKPMRTLIVSKNLTLASQFPQNIDGNKTLSSSSSDMVRFTCPNSGQLIISRSPSFTLKDLRIENCMSNFSIIDLGTYCNVGGPIGTIRFLHLHIERNKLFGQARIVDSRTPFCFHLEFDNVKIRQNLCAGTSCVLLSLSNTLKNLQLLENEGSHNSLWYLSIFSTFQGSEILATNISSEGNKIISFVMSSSALNISNSNFSRNKITSSGSAIFAFGKSNLSISNSIFSSNEVTSGGALFLQKSVNGLISKCAFTNNIAKGYGGAIVLQLNSNLVLIGSTFSDNKAINGAAILIEASSSGTISRCDFANNEAANKGGAISTFMNSTLNVLGSKFSNHKATYGGALYLENSTIGTISQCNFRNNTATNNGGAINVYVKSTITLSSSTFTNNRAELGGALYLLQSSNGTIAECHFTKNKARNSGGVISMDQAATMSMLSTRLEDNSAEFGGVIHMFNSSTSIVSNCSLIGNKATKSAGTIATYVNSILTLSDSFFSSNKASIGGSLHLMDSSKATIFDCSFSNHKAQVAGGAIHLETKAMIAMWSTRLHTNKAQFGGALFLGKSSSGTISNCSFIENSATEGGAICTYENSIFALNASLFSSNEAKQGGALYLQEFSMADVYNCSFTHHKARISGGAICLQLKASIILSFAKLHNNKALAGGGLLLWDSSSAIVSNCSFQNNLVKENGGGALLSAHSILILLSSTFQGNEAAHGGSLCLDDFSTLRSTNANFYSNKASLSGGSITIVGNSSASLTEHSFSGNKAKSGGAIYLQSSSIHLLSILLSSNNAVVGGAIYVWNATMEVINSVIETNHASESGGAIYMESSNATVVNTTIHINKAEEDCGGICVYKMSFVKASNLLVQSNSARNVGGGIGISNASCIQCYSCIISNNTALRGAGMHVYSDDSIKVVAKLQDSRFESNIAKSYGGGIAFATPSDRSINCKNSKNTCGHIVLLHTIFVKNYANHSGAAILTTRASGILIDCDRREKNKQDFFRKTDFSSLKFLNPRQLCEGWIGNHVLSRDFGNIVGTFGQKIELSISLDAEVKLIGDTQSGYVLENVSSGKQLPTIHITVLDGFGVGPAPTMPYSFEAQISSPDRFFRGLYPSNISAGFGSFSDVAGFAHPGKYTLEIKFNTPALEEIKVIIIVRECYIGEEPTRDKLTCQKCDSVSYNYNPSKVGGCMQCPNGGNCEGHYIVPSEGYWHKSPCHDTLHECPMEKACNYDDRHAALKSFTTNFTNCNTTEAEIEAYNDKLCNEGYEGPLCASCKKSYGLSSSFECIKCGHVILSILAIVAITCYLLFGTSISISGTLPLVSVEEVKQDEETPLLEAQTSTIKNSSGSTTRTENEGEIEPSQSEIAQARDDMEAMKRQLSEMWKVVLNFFQVISTATTMDVKWTSTILKLFEKLQILGAATANAISLPIDCIVSSKSNAMRAIWRACFSILVPITVITILALYWGVRFINLHRGERLYFIKRLILTIVTVAYITYFDLTQMVVRVFDCVSVNIGVDFGSKSITRVWIVDTSIECYKETHGILFGITLTVLTLVSIGFPLFCSLVLFVRRDEAYTPKSWAHEVLGFLCGPFKEKFIYWECVTMIKKALLSIIIVFSYSLGNQIQGLLILLVLVFFLYIHVICFPYNEEFHILNYYESGSLLVSCTTYTLVQFFNVERCSKFARLMVSTLIIAVDSGFLSLIAIKIIRDIIHLTKAFLRSKGIDMITFLKSYFKNLRPRFSSD